MASKYWIKLYHEILDDPKMARLSDRLFRRTMQLFLLAGEINGGGHLPDIEDIAWRIRCDLEELELEMIELQGLKIVSKVDGQWLVTKFAERQAPVPGAERVARFRERKQKETYYGTGDKRDGNANETNRYTDTDKIRKDTDKIGVVSSLYEQEIGALTPLIAEQIKDWVDNHPQNWIEEAIEIAVKSNKRKVRYVNGILKNWRTDGKDSKKIPEEIFVELS